MRFYAIKFEGSVPPAFRPVPGAYVKGAQFCSVVNGVNDPGALNLSFSVEETLAGQPNSNNFFRLQGVSFDMIRQSSDLRNCNASIYVGMFPGLPLATAQSHLGTNQGFLVGGSVQFAFGNWQGTDMSLDVVLAPGAGTTSAPSGPTDAKATPMSGPSGPIAVQQAPTQGRAVGPVLAAHGLEPGAGGPFALAGGGRPSRLLMPARGLALPRAGPIPLAISGGGLGGAIGAAESVAGGFIQMLFGGGGYAQKPQNLIHDMAPGTTLDQAIRKTLSTAFPKATLDIKISPNLKLAYQDTGFYQTLSQYAAYVRALSLSILGTSKYLGVGIIPSGNTIKVFDQTQPTGGPSIAAHEFVGQPTWINPDQAGRGAINFKTVMRADLKTPATVTIPKGIPIANSPDAALNWAKSGTLTFGGQWDIFKALHVGDFRNPDGNAWVSNFWAYAHGDTQGQTPAADNTKKVDTSYGPQLPVGAHSGFASAGAIGGKRALRRYG